MYNVVYITKNGEERRIRCATQAEAVAYYRQNLSNMAYGYVSDDEALEVAETVKNDYEEEKAREMAEALAEQDILSSLCRRPMMQA